MSASTQAARRREFDAASEADTAPSGGVPRFGESRPILFVDGCCVLCQRAARWVALHDRHGQVALAALQGVTARRLLPAALCGAEAAGAPGSAVWRTADGTLLVRSTAVLAAVAALGGWHRAAVLLQLVPAPIRDALYLAIARGRRRWFGATVQCRLPNGRLPSEVGGSVVLD